MKKRFAVLLTLMLLTAGCALAEVQPVELTFTNRFAKLLTDSFNEWIWSADDVAWGETVIAAGSAFEGHRLMNDVCFQEEDGRSALSEGKGSREGQQKALLQGFRLLQKLTEEEREAVYAPGFVPKSFESADFRSLELEGTVRLDVMRAAFPVADGGSREELLAIRFLEDERVTLWLTGDESLLTAYGQILRPAATPAPAPEKPMNLTVRIRDGKAVNVRETPAKSGKAVGWALGGESYPLLSTAENGWVQIRLPNGKEGYVSPKMIR